MFPSFLIIGAQKAGTTWLYRNLLNHPQIWMPKEKELHYFGEKDKFRATLLSKLRGERAEDQRWRRQFRRQLNTYPSGLSLKNLAWDLNYFFRPPSDKWYASLFRQGRGKITGETTPDYCVLKRDEISHVREIMPKTKIVFMMRNPIERAWSQALMERGGGRSPEEIPDEELRRHFDGKRSRLLTDYLRTIDNWSSLYPEEQIFVGFLEDIHFAPGRLLKRLYGFLGADPSVEYRVIQRKIHTRDVETIPTRHAAYLARAYREDVARLEERFGGYASFWRHCAERLIEDPPAGGSLLPYPLWESPLWQEWARASEKPAETGSRAAPLRSGPLSRIQAVT